MHICMHTCTQYTQQYYYNVKLSRVQYVKCHRTEYFNLIEL